MSRPSNQRSSSAIVSSAQRPLEGRLAIITGGSRGIGAAAARQLAAKGAYVVLTYTADGSTEKINKLAEEIQNEYETSALVVQADIGNVNGPQHIIDTAKNHFSHPRSGKFQIDIIVNNAGIAENQILEKVTVEDYHRQYDVNVLGPLLLVQAALPFLPKDRSGRIVNVSSVSSSLGLTGQSVYGGTKAALEAMTRTWSRELAERATVNAINPGPVATDMYASTNPEFQLQMKPHIQHSPLMKERRGVDPDQYVDDAPRSGGRPGYDHEIASLVSMLCTEESAWCTGSVLCANGGMKFSY